MVSLHITLCIVFVFIQQLLVRKFSVNDTSVQRKLSIFRRLLGRGFEILVSHFVCCVKASDIHFR
jgi:hypothetical protein